jgi:hypothetical protein
MRLPLSIYSVSAVVLAIGLGTGCLKPQVEIAETADSVAVAADARGYDPLELARDRELVPELFPRADEIVGKQVILEKNAAGPISDSTLGEGKSPAKPSDTLNSQSYKVQIFTGLVYGEARQIARVAEEIFDQPVSVDYEVPNFKVRIGNWQNRASAELYQQKARAVGYTNAWVVMAGVNVREVAPLYDDLSRTSGMTADSARDTATIDGDSTGSGN